MVYSVFYSDDTLFLGLSSTLHAFEQSEPKDSSINYNQLLRQLNKQLQVLSHQQQRSLT